MNHTFSKRMESQPTIWNWFKKNYKMKWNEDICSIYLIKVYFLCNLYHLYKTYNTNMSEENNKKLNYWFLNKQDHHTPKITFKHDQVKLMILFSNLWFWHVVVLTRDSFSKYKGKKSTFNFSSPESGQNITSGNWNTLDLYCQMLMDPCCVLKPLETSECQEPARSRRDWVYLFKKKVRQGVSNMGTHENNTTYRPWLCL